MVCGGFRAAVDEVFCRELVGGCDHNMNEPRARECEWDVVAAAAVHRDILTILMKPDAGDE